VVHADLGEGEIIVFPKWDEEARFKMVPGSGYRGRTKTWHAPLSYATLVTMRGIFGSAFTYTDKLAEYAAAEVERVQRCIPFRFLTDAPCDSNDKLDLKMYPFQRADVFFMLAAGQGCLANEAGTGKTISLLSFLRKLSNEWNMGPEYLDYSPFPALIIVPKPVLYHWAVRAETWVPGADVFILEGSVAQKRKILAEAEQSETAIVLCNLESVSRFSRLAPFGNVHLKRCKECDPKYGEAKTPAQCHVHPKEFNRFGFHTVIVDEAHRIGEPTSQQTRAIYSVAHGKDVRWRWTATGTPDQVEKLWSMMHAVAPHEYPTKSKWIDRYGLVVPNYMGGFSIAGFRPDTRDEAMKILDPRFRRMPKALVLPQLPPVVREVRRVTMTPPMARAYKDLNTQLYTQLPDGSSFIATNKVVARGRQMQFASATVEVEKPDENDLTTWIVHMREPSPKLDEMEAVIEDLESKPFVVAVHHRDMAELVSARLEKLGIEHEVIMGGVSAQSSEIFVSRLNNGQLRALVFTIAAGGTGLDMSGVDTMIRLQRSDSLIQNIQCEERLSRPGAEKHASQRIVDIITEDTVEINQAINLMRRLEQMDQITRDRASVAAELSRADPQSKAFADLLAKMYSLTSQYSALASQSLEDEAA
jgi:SNF2 family DNA or RNA helicase